VQIGQNSEHGQVIARRREERFELGAGLVGPTQALFEDRGPAQPQSSHVVDALGERGPSRQERGGPLEIAPLLGRVLERGQRVVIVGPKSRQLLPACRGAGVVADLGQERRQFTQHTGLVPIWEQIHEGRERGGPKLHVARLAGVRRKVLEHLHVVGERARHTRQSRGGLLRFATRREECGQIARGSGQRAARSSPRPSSSPSSCSSAS